MKLQLFFLVLLSWLFACSSATEDQSNPDPEDEEAKNAMHIHFQSGFYQDTVSLYHGREKIYEKVLTTADGEKITDQFSFPLASIKDTLYFRVAQEGQVLKGFIPPNTDQYVGFYLTSGTAVNIYSKKTPFLY